MDALARSRTERVGPSLDAAAEPRERTGSARRL
jgi:hypothetical protein